jgi:transketolase
VDQVSPANGTDRSVSDEYQELKRNQLNMGEQVTYSMPEAVEASTAGIQLVYLDKVAFDVVIQSPLPAKQKAELFARMARFNTLYMVARAGSGHLGSSFSSLDLVTWLYLNILKPDDRYFSSKGHDSPGLYAVQTALGVIPFEKIHALRRLDGLPGHPDVNTPGAHTNTGSLGMGVSKAKGFLFADELLGNHGGRIFVLTGDGELQEGQFWESLITASRRRDGRLTVIVDHNKIQSDTHVSNVSDLGDLEAKFKAFGWDVVRCNGHDYGALERIFDSESKDGRPRAIIADTIKGRGVSFMEHTAMKEGQEYYQYHSGAPDPDNYKTASAELAEDIKTKALALGLKLPKLVEVSIEPLRAPQNSERMIPAYTEALLAEARINSKIVSLDADLILDTGLIPFKDEFRDRFVECGIAEQDMVSQAGTMALAGLIPIVHSFACFLTSRASEQIYNNCTQGGKVIYVGSLAGVLPGGPGHSHQAVRDITSMSAMPGLTIVEPINAKQVKSALSWAVNKSEGSTYLRLTSIPYEQNSELSEISELQAGKGQTVREGSDVLVIAFGPVMAFQALQAATILSKKGISVAVVATPWINKINQNWIKSALGNVRHIVTLENHYTECGAGSFYITTLACLGLLSNRNAFALGVDEIPVCGRNDEVLTYHRLTGDLLASLIVEKILA